MFTYIYLSSLEGFYLIFHGVKCKLLRTSDIPGIRDNYFSQVFIAAPSPPILQCLNETMHSETP